MTSTRSKAQPIENGERNKKLSQKARDLKVFFIDGELVNESREDIEIVSLRNPCTGNASRYVYAKHLKKFYEILSFSEKPRAWFINNTICSTGDLYMTSAFDPLFWALYYIRQNSGKRCVPLEHALIDDNFSKTNLLEDVFTIEQLSMIADQIGDDDLKVFKFNEAKTLKWLTLKCKALATGLKDKKFHIGAKSINFVKTEKFDDGTQKFDTEYLSYALGMLGEYIQPDLLEKLTTFLGLEKVKSVAAGKRKSLVELEHDTTKRSKSNGSTFETKMDSAIKEKEKKVSTKEKQLAKAASGTKSISSFFTKK